MTLTDIQLDRAVGALLGGAVGDALGAPYEFKPPVADHVEVVMKSGDGWALGEWTDDTSMAIPIARVVARGDRLEGVALDELVTAWAGWALEAKDVGIQTRQVLGGLGAPTAAEALASSRRVHDRSGRSGGNGSLMRTGPVALGYLDDEAGLIAAARVVSDLTHYEQDAGDDCVIWSVAIRHAILTGLADVRVGVAGARGRRPHRARGTRGARVKLHDIHSQTALAEHIATEAHRGQVDKLGADYIGHPRRVASAFDPQTQWVEYCAALLRDVVEDTGRTADDLLASGVDAEVVDTVVLLTRQDDADDDWSATLGTFDVMASVRSRPCDI